MHVRINIRDLFSNADICMGDFLFLFPLFGGIENADEIDVEIKRTRVPIELRRGRGKGRCSEMRGQNDWGLIYVLGWLHINSYGNRVVTECGASVHSFA